jgi:sterol desaturase/sphingolipid hydroxylase (fatty acid hydroxylase superfamily)
LNDGLDHDAVVVLVVLAFAWFDPTAMSVAIFLTVSNAPSPFSTTRFYFYIILAFHVTEYYTFRVSLPE